MGFFPHRNIAVADGLLWWLYPTPEKIKVWLVFWLVVSTPLKNISQLALLFPIYGKIRNVPNQREVPLWKGKNDYNWIQLADFPWPSQIPEPWLSQFRARCILFCCWSNRKSPLEIPRMAMFSRNSSSEVSLLVHVGSMFVFREKH